MPQKYFLTTPIYYVNARPHIGHAYTTIVADVLARRHRLLGEDVFFLTGTDEHGQKIERSAAAAGIPPQQFADQVSQSFRDLWKRMGITYTDFIRTTEPRHHRAVQKLFQALEANGKIYLSSYTGQYCVSEEMFVEGPPGTIGPDGRPTETVTEENYFFRLSEYQLPLLSLIESNTLVIEPEARRNEVLSFLRGDVSNALEKISYDPEGYRTSVGGVEWQKKYLDRTAANTPYVPGALRDLSISRSSFTWGIPVKGNERHVIYVWLDALANYMTAVGYGSDDPLDLAKFEKYWPADLHIVGKEIIRFHCIYWPAFLLAANLPLPKKVVAHGWLLFEESKMSKSRGNIVRTETILDAFGPLCPAQLTAPNPTSSTAVVLDEVQNPRISPIPAPSTKAQQDLFASDILRYFLLREIPFGQDGSFSFDAMITRYNADLANGYGNLVSRTLKLIELYFESSIPTYVERESVTFQILTRKLPRGGFTGHPTNLGPFIAGVPDLELARTATVITFFYERAFDDLRFSLDLDFRELLDAVRSKGDVTEGERGALDYVALLIAETDTLLSAEAPWKLAKQKDRESQSKLSDILYTAAESIRILTALLYPILPFATASVWRQLGLGDIEHAAKNGELNNLQWGGLQPGTKLGSLSPIFPRADKGLAQTMANIEASQAKPLASVTTQADAATPTTTEFPITSLASELVTNPPEHFPTTDPAAGFRTTSLPEPSPGTLVAGSSSLTTEREAPPSSAPLLPEPQPGMSGSTPEATTPTDASPQITIDDFAKVELRVAKVLVAERIPKADKLLRLEVDLGYERRQILSGIAEWYTPEDLLDRRIVVITNLAPRKMRGLESHGMLLAASAPDGGKPSLATFPDTDDLPLGSRLK